MTRPFQTVTAVVALVACLLAGAPPSGGGRDGGEKSTTDPAAETRETARDYAVIEAALNDLNDPKNPEYKYHIQNVGPGRGVVVGNRLMAGDPFDDRFGPLGSTSTNIDGRDRRPIPADLRADVKRRNDGRKRSLAGFAPRNPEILVRDLDAQFKDADDFVDAFLKAYPKTWGYVWPYRPGYSKDGRTALLVFEGGPNGDHGLNWVYVLAHGRDRWSVRWRHCRPRE